MSNSIFTRSTSGLMLSGSCTVCHSLSIALGLIEVSRALRGGWEIRCRAPVEEFVPSPDGAEIED